MNQSFTIGNLKLIEDEEGYGVAEKSEDGFVVVASFKYPLDALKYFTEYALVSAEMLMRNTHSNNPMDAHNDEGTNE